MKAVWNEKAKKFEAPKYDALRQSIYYMHKHATETLVSDRGNVLELTKKEPWAMGDFIRGNIESWFKASAILMWTHQAMDLLAEKTMERLEKVGGIEFERELESALIAEELECAAEEVRTAMTGEVLKKLIRGVEHTSNPAAIVQSTQEHEAAQSVLERICGVPSYYRMHSVAKDIIEGIERRAAEESARRAMLTKTIKVTKRDARGGGEYIAQSFNEDGDQLSFIELNTKRKGDALLAARAWADELMDSKKNIGTIRVEAN